MNKLEYLVIHCTATPKDRDVTKDDIIRWHTNPKELGGRGWGRVGYSDMVYLDGSLVNLTPFNQDENVDPWEVTNGAKGINGKSRHVVYVGGLDIDPELACLGDEPSATFNDRYVHCDTRTDEQLATLEVYVKYMIARHPSIKIAGHNQFSPKDCPCFNVPQWLRAIGVEEKNIHLSAS